MKAANPATTRKQVVEECVRRGIALYTARTQFQRWSKMPERVTVVIAPHPEVARRIPLTEGT